MKKRRHAGYQFLAGTPSLDFANTVRGGRGRNGVDQLADYGDLLTWSVEAGLVSTKRAAELKVLAKCHGVDDIFSRSVKLREAIYAIFSSLAAQRKAPAAALQILNRELVEAMRNARIVPRGRTFDWQLPHDVCGLFYPLQAIARDAGELLTSRLLKEVRECASKTCNWLFLDETRNHSRLWCDMSVCGNRVKQARYRTRSAK